MKTKRNLKPLGLPKRQGISTQSALDWVIALLILSLLLLVFVGCANVTPKIDEPSMASFDGNDLNSGIVGQIQVVDASGNVRFGAYEITPGARERYNAFVSKYGSRLDRPIKQDFGVTPMLGSPNFHMTLEAAELWEQMILLKQADEIQKAGSILNKIGL